jgi:hypothetical protein
LTQVSTHDPYGKISEKRKRASKRKGRGDRRKVRIITRLSSTSCSLKYLRSPVVIFRIRKNDGCFCDIPQSESKAVDTSTYDKPPLVEKKADTT